MRPSSVTGSGEKPIRRGKKRMPTVRRLFRRTSRAASRRAMRHAWMRAATRNDAQRLPAPPGEYWMTKGRLAEYFQAVQDWSNGYRTGAAMARARGARMPGIYPTAAPGPGGAWPPELFGWPGWISNGPPAVPEPTPLP